MADDNKMSTSQIQMVAAGQIARQAELCYANLERVKDKIESINGDMSDIARSLKALRDEVTKLTLDMTKQVAALNAEIGSLKQKWSIWPTLKDALLVIVTLASLYMSVWTFLNK